MAESRPRQNFHQESEAGINKQINMELYASYVYQSMVRLLTQRSVCLVDFASYQLRYIIVYRQGEGRYKNSVKNLGHGSHIAGNKSDFCPEL